MKGIKRDEAEHLDALVKAAAAAKGVALLELQIKIVVRLRKLLSSAAGSSGKDSVCADIVNRYAAPMLQWLHFSGEEANSLMSTGRAKVTEDVLWVLTSIINSTHDYSQDLLRANVVGIPSLVLTTSHTPSGSRPPLPLA